MTLDPEVKCYLPGIPRATYMPYAFQILQSHDSDVLMAYEYASASRVIKMGATEPPPVDTWMGQSTGAWDGDTLVVDTIGFNDRTWFDRAGNFHSEALHVIERFTPKTPDLLDYDAIIEDPRVFTRPWKILVPLYRRQDTGRATARVQVRGVCRRADVRSLAQEDGEGEALRARAHALAVTVPSSSRDRRRGLPWDADRAVRVLRRRSGGRQTTGGVNASWYVAGGPSRCASASSPASASVPRGPLPALAPRSADRCA